MCIRDRPTAETLYTQMKKNPAHPDSAIMETPYTSKVLKGFTKIQFMNMEFYKND